MRIFGLALLFSTALPATQAEDSVPVIGREQAEEVSQSYFGAMADLFKESGDGAKGMTNLQTDDSQFCLGTMPQCFDKKGFEAALPMFESLLSDWQVDYGDFMIGGHFATAPFRVGYYCKNGALSQANGRMTVYFDGKGGITHIDDVVDRDTFASAWGACGMPADIEDTPKSASKVPLNVLDALVDQDVRSWRATIGDSWTDATPTAFSHIAEDVDWCITDTCGKGKASLLQAAGGFGAMGFDMTVTDTARYRGANSVTYDWYAFYKTDDVSVSTKGMISMDVDSNGQVSRYRDLLDMGQMAELLAQLVPPAEKNEL